ncbi:MAG: hypothetical protein GX640_08750 [Fibrobacter sp.]|nr:hypothetical protein [Fibrobacter sp.]
MKLQKVSDIFYFRFIYRAIIICISLFLFSCFNPVTESLTDFSEFESVWQYLKIYSIYQDSSIYKHRIPDNPFVFDSPQALLHAVNDTLWGHHYTDYEYDFTSYSSLKKRTIFDGSVSFAIDSTTGTISIVNGFVDGVTYNEFKLCMSGAARCSTLIIDLRGNGGGSIEEVDSIVEAFVPAGKRYIMARERSFNGKIASTIDWHPWETRRNAFAQLQNKRIIVYVDGGTASASEILAVALRDCLGAPLVGERTYGKGIGQIIIERRNRWPLKITYLQLRRNTRADFFNGPGTGVYHHTGIEPDTFRQWESGTLTKTAYKPVPFDCFKTIHVE